MLHILCRSLNSITNVRPFFTVANLYQAATSRFLQTYRIFRNILPQLKVVPKLPYAGLTCSAFVLIRPLLINRLPLLRVECKKRTTPLRHNVAEVEPRLRFRDMLWLLKPFAHWLLVAVTSAIIVAFINIKIPILLGNLVNVIADITNGNGSAHSDLYTIAMTIAGHYALQSFFTFFYISSLSILGERIATQLRQQLFDALISQEMKFFDLHRTGELSSRINSDVLDFKSSFKLCVSQGLRTVTQIGGSVVALYFISAKMTLVTVACLPLMVLCGALFGHLLRVQSRRAQQANAQASSHALESLSNIRTVRAFAAERQRSKELANDLALNEMLHEQLGIGIGIFQGFANLVLNGIVLSVLYGGTKLIALGELLPGDLMSFLVTAQTIQKSMAQFSVLFGQAVRGYTAGARVFEFINKLPEQHLTGGICIAYHSLIGLVSFNNVSFAYPTRPEQEVLVDFCLNLPQGKTTALVGHSGAGKSTIVALLERFYDVNSGSITIDGVDLRQLDATWLRTHALAFISQEPVLFDTSIRENIKFGKRDATMTEIQSAAKSANAHDFIETFPQGYDTVVGERGAALSGGQKQRIAIARALLRDTPILILDEATSALDADSERQVHEALDKASLGRTVIIIAHRLSTIQQADNIAVINKGRVVEEGTHAQLMKKKGAYYKLVNLQSESDFEKLLK